MADIHLRGGSILHTSRANPTKKRETLEACVASLGTLHTYHRLPAHHRDDETLQTVRLVANLFGMLSSLVLGFMVSSANSNFADADKAVHAYATEIILLDHALRGLGPDAAGDPAADPRP